jgi:hypothetical protein
VQCTVNAHTVQVPPLETKIGEGNQKKVLISKKFKMFNNLHREFDEKNESNENHIHTDIHEEDVTDNFTYNVNRAMYVIENVIEKIAILSVYIFIIVVILKIVCQALLSFVSDLRDVIEDLAYNTLYVGGYFIVIVGVCAVFYIVYRFVVWKFFD